MSNDFWLPSQPTGQFPELAARVGPWQIRSEELEEAMTRAVTPALVEAEKGALKTPLSHCICAQDLKDLIPVMVEGMRSQFVQEVRGLIPVMVEAMRSAYAQEFRAFIPDVVEEVLKKLGHYPSSRSSVGHTDSSASRILQLHFDCLLPTDGLYTLTNIQNHKGASIKVELRDGSGSTVEDGPESSAMIEISVLDGGFEFENRDDWTAQDFDKNVVKPREHKGPLLKGEYKILMSKGVAVLSNLAFTDNSKAMRVGKFRFRARVVKGLPLGVYVRDGVSEAFRVKEHRMKRHTRSLDDNTRCLKHIGTTLCQKLADAKIDTLQDFLQQYHTDPKVLQKILQVSENKWSELAKDVESCSFTDNGYQYLDEESGITLLLDCVFNIFGFIINGQALHPHHLDDIQKNRIRCIAYEKRKKLPRIDIRTNRILVPTESVSLQGIPHTNTQDLEANTADKTTTIITPSANFSINRVCGVQDMTHSLSPDQTDQGTLGNISERGELHLQSSLDRMISEPELIIDETAFFEGCLDSTVFDGTDPYLENPYLKNQFGGASSTNKVQVIRFRSIAYVVRFKTAIKLSIKTPRAFKRLRHG